jgi:hypothetical protein
LKIDRLGPLTFLQLECRQRRYRRYHPEDDHDAGRIVFVPGRGDQSGRHGGCSLQDVVQEQSGQRCEFVLNPDKKIAESKYANNSKVSATNPKFN